MRDVYLVSAVRTPIGRFGGSLKDHTPAQLAAHVMEAALAKGGVTGADLDMYIFGNVLSAGQGQLVPRQAAFQIGIPREVDGYAVDMVCSSGMMAVVNAAVMIKAGEADLVLAGGTESMSGTGYYLSHKARWGYKYGGEPLVDLLAYDGLSDPFSGDAMGVLTEKLIAERGVTREELDAVAAESHKRAVAAQESGVFANEIVPITYQERRKTLELSVDEGVRADTTLDTLAGLRTAFDKNGALTAGNSSQISDGAASLLLASADAVKKYGLKPLARFSGWALTGSEPYRFPEAPVPAVNKLLKKTNRTVTDFDLFENNEAFAVNSVLFHRMLGVSYDKLNVLGGAIALGHPIGCSGARILVTLVNGLGSLDKQSGIAAICHGTGGGTAVAIDRV